MFLLLIYLKTRKSANTHGCRYMLEYHLFIISCVIFYAHRTQINENPSFRKKK